MSDFRAISTITAVIGDLLTMVQDDVTGVMNQQRKERKISPTFIVLLVIVIIGISLLIYTLHSYKKIYQISFAEDKIIISDGAGSYPTSEIDRVQFSSANPLIIEMRYCTRHVMINFHSTQWKDENLVETSPRLLTDNYRVILRFDFNGIDYTKLNVGERLTPYEIGIDLIDKNGINNFLPWTIARSDDASQPITYVPLELYDEGHAFLTRESEDVWILDVDAWYNAEVFVRQDVWTTYYFRASFKINLEFRPII